MSLPLMFALAFPIEAPAGEPVFAVVMPPAAYATLATPDLRDVVVIDADGRPQPIGWLRAPAGPPPAATEIALPLPVPLPALPETGAGAERLDLELLRDPEGRLLRIDLASRAAMPTSGGSDGGLVDAAAAVQGGYDGLRFTPVGTDDVRARIDLRGSDDLAHWTSLVAGAPLLRVSADGQTFERLEVPVVSTRFRYLWIAPSPGSAPLPALAAVTALRASKAAPVDAAVLRLDAVDIDGQGTRFLFPSPGPLPVTAIAVRPAATNGVLAFTLRQGDDERSPVLLSGMAWQFDVDGTLLRSPPQSAMPPGLGPLRLDTRHPVAPPSLDLHYTADRLLVIAEGRPPFQLLAGSGRYRSDPTATDDAVAGLRAARGADWTPPLGRVGAPIPAGGAAALDTRPRLDAGMVTLWGVLALGVLLVAGVAWRLLRTPPAGA